MTMRNFLLTVLGSVMLLGAALPAGKFVRITPGPGRGQADRPEQLGDAVLAIRFFHVLVQPKRLTNNLLYRHARVQRGEGILKDDL